MGADPDFRQKAYAVAIDVDTSIAGRNALEQAKKQGCPSNVQRFPVAKDHNCQCQETETSHIPVGGAVGGGQRVDKTAHASQCTGNGGASIAHFIDIDPQGVRSLWVLAAGTQPQSKAGFIEDNREDNENNDTDIGGQVDFIEEGIEENTQLSICRET